MFSLVFMIAMVLVVLVIALALMWLSVFSKPRTDLSVCGRCGYGVRGIESLTCPECGADLREVGIVNPRQRGISPAAFVFAWTLGYGFTAFVLVSLAVSFGPQERTGNVSQSFSTVDAVSRYRVRVRWEWRGPSNAPYGANTASARSDGVTTHTLTFGHLKPSTSIRSLVLKAESMSSDAPTTALRRMHIAPDGSGYRYALPDGQLVQGSGLPDAAAIRKWYTDGGLPFDTLTVDAEAKEVAAIVFAVIKRKSPITIQALRPGGRGSGGSTSPVIWWVVLVIAAAIGGWIVGLVMYFRHRRRSASTVSN